MPSSVEVILTVPPLIWITVASRPSFAVMLTVPPSTWMTDVAWMPSSPALRVKVPLPIYTKPFVSSSSFSAWIASVPAARTKVPPAIRMESLASMALEDAVTVQVPPVTFRSSLQTMPLSVEETTRDAVPLSTRSCFEKMTPSVLVFPSFRKEPVTERELSAATVTKTLSAERM